MEKTFLIILAAQVIVGVFLGYQFLNTDKVDTISSFPEQFIDDRTGFAQVKQLFNEAMDLTTPPNDSDRSFVMPKEQEDRIRYKLTEGISLSRKIDDSFLDYLNLDLKNNFRNKYVKGYELFLEGMNSDVSSANSIGVQKQLESGRLMDEFNAWWESNKDAVLKKVYPK
jgi:hypothetical protein